MANYLTRSPQLPDTIQLGSQRAKDDVQYVDNMYKLKLYNRPANPEDEIKLSGYVPEDFQLSLMSNWDEPLAAASDLGGTIGQVLGGKLGAAMQTGGKLTGYNSLIYGAAKTWQGGTSLMFNLPIKLSAYHSTNDEVMEPLKQILKLCTPTLSAGGLLKAPGPTPADMLKMAKQGSITGSPEQWEAALKQALENKAFYLSVGKFFKMFPAIITNVTAQFSGTFEHETGLPFSVELDTTIESYLAPTSYDIDNWLGPFQ